MLLGLTTLAAAEWIKTVIHVEDNGCGLAPDHIELAIAHAVAKHHNGKLDIVPKPHGLCITLSIKRSESQASAIRDPNKHFLFFHPQCVHIQ